MQQAPHTHQAERFAVGGGNSGWRTNQSCRSCWCSETPSGGDDPIRGAVCPKLPPTVCWRWRPSPRADVHADHVRSVSPQCWVPFAPEGDEFPVALPLPTLCVHESQWPEMKIPRNLVASAIVDNQTFFGHSSPVSGETDSQGGAMLDCKVWRCRVPATSPRGAATLPPMVWWRDVATGEFRNQRSGSRSWCLRRRRLRPKERRPSAAW